MKELRKISKEELRGILELHKLWLESEGEEGELANLSYCDLRCVNLSYCDLRDADLRHADLSYCNLRRADLRCAELSDANLTNANLSDANLSYCNLFNTNLTNADLSYCNLSDANLRCVELINTNLYKTNLFNAKVDNMISVGNIGDENRTVYYFYKEDRVICGCFDNTLEEFKKAVIEKYGEDYGSYAIAIGVFEKMKDKK